MNNPLIDRPETQCSCTTCKMMCFRSPCFPTPAEAQLLIQRGFAHKMAISFYEDPFSKTHYVALTGQFEKEKGCAFLTSNFLCELHDPGLKPVEGRLAIHNTADIEESESLRLAVCQTWFTEDGLRVIAGFSVQTQDDEHLKVIALKLLIDHIYAKRRGKSPGTNSVP